MKVTLKNVKNSPSLSQETNAYTADVWVDGVKRGTVRNSGHGGPDEVHPHALLMELIEHAKTLPAISCKGKIPSMQGFTHPASYETVLASALTAALEGKRLARWLKTKIVFVQDGKLYTSTARPAKADLVLNDIPFDRAVEAMVAAVSP